MPSLPRFRVDVMIRLDPPLAIAPHEHFHQLRLDHPVGWNHYARRHRLDAMDFVVDVDQRHLRRDEPDAADRMLLGGALVKRRQDFLVPGDERRPAQM